MAELRRCVCGKDYWFPGERWQHKDHVVTQSVVTREEPAVVTQEALVNVEVHRGALRKVGSESRQVKWQRENRERYNAKMREYRRRRAN